MIISSVRLRRFKRFADWTGTLAPGLTVVRGPNEAGKSTLMEAIFEGLFRDPARTEATGRLRSWGEARLGEITIDLDVRGRRYLLRKDLEAGTVLLQSEDGRDRAESQRDVQRRLLEWVGLGSEAAYRSTAFVAQADIARVSEDRRLLAAHLSRILSGAGVEGVQQALQWLGEQRGRLAAAGGGKSAAQRIAELRAQQESLRQREERAQRHRLELREVTRRLEEVEREAADRAELVRVAKWAADLQQRERALVEEEISVRDHLARAEALLQRLAGLEAELAEFSSRQEALIADLFHARRQYLQLESNLQTASQQAQREERTLEHLATLHHSAKRTGAVGWSLAVAGGAGVLGGGVVVSLLQSWQWAGWALLVAGAISTVAGMRLRGRISEAGGHYRTQEQRVLDLRRRIEVMQRQLAEAQEVVAGKLRGVGGASLEEVERRFSRYMELLKDREEVRAALRQIRGSDPKAALETRLKEIADELAAVRATMETLPRGARKAPAIGPEAAEQQAKQLNAELADLREKRARLEGVLDEMRDRGDEAARLEEEIAALELKATRDRQALEVVELTARLLEEARTQSVYPARELLERRMGEYLTLATDGAYGRVAVDERTLRPQVWVPAAGAWKDAAELSQGTSDQLYLCLRLALLDVIAADRRPPLFLDEPFAHLDEQRRRAMLDVLAAAAKDRQVILFTCWPHYDAAAARVVLLDRAAAASPAPDPSALTPAG
ncbi:MAG: AAA family ATPase [Armatimonadota bacterium]|nr:AAA family ATPase [Armatimonadota bacterium]